MNQITIRIYFEHGKKVKGLTFRQRLFHSGFAHQLLKSAKQAGIRQAICFHVTSGYLALHKQIQWERSEYTPPRHPQCIELMDEEDKMNYFLDVNKDLLFDTDLFVVKNEIVLKT